MSDRRIWYVAVNDLFRVEADDPEAATQEVAERLGEDPFLVTDLEIVDSEEVPDE